jgi:hypothetical protein
VKRLVIALVATTALAGCGGSHSQLYTLAAVKQCLVAAKIPLTPAKDFVATTATGGSARAIFPSNAVTLVFGLTQSDADNIDAAYRRFHGKNVGVEDVLRQDHNAVLLWQFHPADADAGVIGGCLTS